MIRNEGTWNFTLIYAKGMDKTTVIKPAKFLIKIFAMNTVCLDESSGVYFPKYIKTLNPQVLCVN